MSLETFLRKAWTDGALFETKFQSIVRSRKDVRIGQIAHYHMVVEHFLMEFLVAARLCSPRESPSYRDKILLAMYPKSPVGDMEDGLKALGTIRNSYVHNLTYSPDEKLLTRLRAYVSRINAKAARIYGKEDFEVERGDLVIEQYTLVASAQLAAMTQLMTDGDIQRPPKKR